MVNGLKYRLPPPPRQKKHVLHSYLFFLGQLAVLFGQDLGEVQVAHLGVQLGVLGPLLHEEAEVRCEWLLGEVGVLLWGGL